MARSNFSVELLGLPELRESLNMKKIPPKIATSIASDTRKLHSEISFAVTSLFNVRPNVLNTVLDKGRRGNEKFGRAIIEDSLTYVWKPIPLARFQDGIGDEGKIGGWFYATHFVKIKRNNSFASMAGFIPRQGFGRGSSPGKPVKTRNFYTTGYQMLERVEDDRYPLKLLFGPSYAEMARQVVDNNPPNVAKALNSFEENIISILEKQWAAK